MTESKAVSQIDIETHRTYVQDLRRIPEQNRKRKFIWHRREKNARRERKVVKQTWLLSPRAGNGKCNQQKEKSRRFSRKSYLQPISSYIPISAYRWVHLFGTSFKCGYVRVYVCRSNVLKSERYSLTIVSSTPVGYPCLKQGQKMIRLKWNTRGLKLSLKLVVYNTDPIPSTNNPCVHNIQMITIRNRESNEAPLKILKIITDQRGPFDIRMCGCICERLLLNNKL